MQRGFVCFIRSCSRNANNLLLNFYYIEIKVQSSSFYIRCKKSYFRCSRESFFTEKISTIFYVWLEYILLVLFVCCLWMCAIDVKAGLQFNYFSGKCFISCSLSARTVTKAFPFSVFFQCRVREDFESSIRLYKTKLNQHKSLWGIPSLWKIKKLKMPQLYVRWIFRFPFC